MRFEWDADKERASIRKHNGIDFEIAAKVFDDPNFVLCKDRIDDETGEQRWARSPLTKERFCGSSLML